MRVRVRARRPVLTSSSSQFSAFLYVSSPLYYLLSLNACTVGCHNRLTPQHRFAPLEYEFSELRRKMSDFYSKKTPTFYRESRRFLQKCRRTFLNSPIVWVRNPPYLSPSLSFRTLFCLSPSPPYALLLLNYDPNWGIMGKFPIF